MCICGLTYRHYYVYKWENSQYIISAEIRTQTYVLSGLISVKICGENKLTRNITKCKQWLSVGSEFAGNSTINILYTIRKIFL